MPAKSNDSYYESARDALQRRIVKQLSEQEVEKLIKRIESDDVVPKDKVDES